MTHAVPTRRSAVRVLAAALNESLGPDRLAFLQGLTLQRRIGDYVFVHAGMHPDRALDAQTEQDLLWIREPFLSGENWQHPVTVVHGHTPEGDRKSTRLNSSH